MTKKTAKPIKNSKKLSTVKPLAVVKVARLNATKVLSKVSPLTRVS